MPGQYSWARALCNADELAKLGKTLKIPGYLEPDGMHLATCKLILWQMGLYYDLRYNGCEEEVASVKHILCV